MASTHKSLRSSTASKRPTTSIADGQIALNTNAASPGLFFKDSAGTEIIKVGPVHVGTTAPNSTPATGGSTGNSKGEVWLDTSLTPIGVKIWDGSAWQNATPSGSTTVQGLLELATNAETQTGTDTARAVTPAGLQSKMSDSTSTSSSTTIASSTAVKAAYDLANAALPLTGGTVTGNLEIGSTGSLSFEGATADDFETTIAVTDPTADRTITLPDTTGTVVTTGDSGTVTSTMIADGTIVNADVNASAAIAGTKISPNFGAQTLVVDTNVLYVNPTTDRVGIGTTSPGAPFHIGTTATNTYALFDDGTNARITFNGSTSTAGIYSTTTGFAAYEDLEIRAAAAIFKRDGTNESARIDTSGNVGIGTSSPNYNIDLQTTSTSLTHNLKVNAAAATGNYAEIAFQLWSGAGSGANTFGGSGTSRPGVVIRAIDEAGDARGDLVIGTFLGGATNATLTEKLRLTAAGRLGIGTTSPESPLHVAGSAITFEAASDPGTLTVKTLEAGGAIQFRQSSGSSDRYLALGKVDNADTFYEACRVDDSLRLLVGTSSAVNTAGAGLLQVVGGDAARPVIHRNINDQYPPVLYFSKARGTGNQIVNNNDELGIISFLGYDGSQGLTAAAIAIQVDGTPGSNDMPGRLVFSTTADGASSPTERMRIDNGGTIKVHGQMQFTDGASGNDKGAIQAFGDDFSNGNLRFYSKGSGTLTERMRITSNGYFKADNQGTYHDSTGNYHEFMSNNGALPALTCAARNTGFFSEAFSVGCFRSASSAYSIAKFFSGNGTTNPYADIEFNLRGDGNAYADGAWNGGGADYAEYFEWSDGNTTAEDRRGISVVLDGDKIREAVAGEEPIGVISGNPSVVGDADIERWKGKYLRDEFGTYIQEDYEVEDEDGNTVTQQRRKLNPDYDPDVKYISREDRPEWDCVGLMGKLRIRKGQVTGSRWIKMRDISDNVEEWLVR